MKKILTGIAAVVVGWIGGSAVNLGLINLGHSVFPLAGVDPNDMEALGAAMQTAVENGQHEIFLFPFLAHALGTLVGALIAYLIAPSHKLYYALGIGAFFLLGGIAVNVMLPGPMWFKVLDQVVAYLPMAWLGGMIGRRFQRSNINKAE